MANTQLLGADSRARRKIFRHEEDGRTWIETRQDVTNLVDVAKFLRDNADLNGKDDSELGVRVAIIPKSELDRAFCEGWFHDQEAWKRWANDPANAAYRTTEGTI